MKVTGNAVLHAAPAEVFAALNDPEVLARTIPGCRALTPLGNDCYALEVTAGVASVKGTYEGQVRLADQQPPHAFTLRAVGTGAPGTVDTTVRVSLAEDDHATRLEYEADAVVGGMVGGVGQRVLSGVARKMAGQFFAAVDAELRGVPAAASIGAPPERLAREPAVPEPAGAAAAGAPEPDRVTPAPVVARIPVAAGPVDDRVPFWVVLAGVGAGAFWALAGVLVGWRIARSGAGSRR
jgi:carbon monoxide dehydrogenase subunit G